jgi:hypothetical protein
MTLHIYCKYTRYPFSWFDDNMRPPNLNGQFFSMFEIINLTIDKIVLLVMQDYVSKDLFKVTQQEFIIVSIFLTNTKEYNK